MTGPTLPQPPPKPNFVAALILAAILVYNLTLDFLSEYDGSKLTYVLAIGLCLVLGVDVSKIWRGRGE